MVPALMGGGTCIETIKSPVIRLDDYLREREGAIGRVTLIKIDTEGFEFPVLKGLQGFFESGEAMIGNDPVDEGNKKKNGVGFNE